MEILAVKNLSFSYPDAASPALENISFSVSEGEFIVLCGEYGCGKTTLLRLLKRELAPAGKISGEISLFDKPQSELDERASASEIGYVMQNPETQIVTDKVWHELAFGMEGLGFESEKIRLRAGEMAGYFGIDSWFRADTASLSGGQKQRVAIAGIIALMPDIIIFDESTAMLDPSGRAEVLETIKRLNREKGITILHITHYMEEAILADNVIVIDDGKILTRGTPREVFSKTDMIRRAGIDVPQTTELFRRLGIEGTPLTPAEGADIIEKLMREKKAKEKAN